MEKRKEKKARNKISVFCITSVLLLFLILETRSGMQLSENPIWYVGPLDPPSYPNFTSIQEAIDDPRVLPGHVIEVLENRTSLLPEAPYYENVVLNKSLTIRNRLGDRPIIDGRGNGTVVCINASNVNFTGFNIQNGNYGIYVANSSSHDNITANAVQLTKSVGIYVGGGGNNFLKENNVKISRGSGVEIHSPNNILRSNMMNDLMSSFDRHNFGIYDFDIDVDNSNMVNGKPIYYMNESNLVIDPLTFPSIGYLGLTSSENVTVRNLTLKNNGQGLLIVNSTGINVENLTLTDNGQGLLIVNSTGINVENLTLTGNEVGVELVRTNTSTVKNVKANGPIGVSLQYSNDSTIVGNTIIGYQLYGWASGIIMNHSHNSTIVGNIIIGYQLGGCGIFVDFSHNSTIFRNDILENLYGIILENSNGSKIYQNNFINNPEQIWSSGGSTAEWDNGREGNFWSDYEGEDSNGDGIGDQPYLVDQNPLMEEWVFQKTFNVTRYGGKYAVTTFSNSTRASLNWTRDQMRISFKLTSGTNELINITIPRDWLEGPFNVRLNGTTLEPEYFRVSEDTNNSYVFFNFTAGRYSVEIIGTRTLGFRSGDLNNDGIIDIFDIVIVALSFGEED
jgi:parallel beta-helix repeat protein